MIKTICNIISGTILVFLVAFAALLFAPKIAGYESMAVISGSMEPKIPIGALVLVDSQGAKDVKIGDSISYKLSADTVVTHRVVEINEATQEIITKGDANNTNDGKPVRFENVMGKVVFTIPYLGYFIIKIRTPIGVAVACALVFVLILTSIIPSLLQKDKKKLSCDENVTSP